MAVITTINLPASQAAPVGTVVVPVAIVNEHPDDVIRTVAEIAYSAVAAGPVRIMLWCNATTHARKPIILRHFQKLVAAMERYVLPSGAGLQLTLDVLPDRFPPTALGLIKKIKQVRTNYMQAIVSEWRKGTLPADHSVLWFDADTTFIDPSTVPLMIQALKNNKAYFVKGRMVYTGHPEDNRPLDALSASERTAVIYAALHRVLDDTLGAHDMREYTDECGLGFRLSTYVAAGGLARSRGDLQGESRILIGRAKRKLQKTIPLLTYAPNAWHGTSYRRLQAMAEHAPAYALSVQSGETYFLSSDLKQQPATVSIQRSDVQRLVEAMLEQHAKLHAQNVPAPALLQQINEAVRLAFPEIDTIDTSGMGDTDAASYRNNHARALLEPIIYKAAFGRRRTTTEPLARKTQVARLAETEA